jgi:type IX secretion system PorP/SprF family membrane protein
MKRIIQIFIGLSVMVSKAQDLHFSQFFTTQMILNPALTGSYQNDFGISGIYRTQWNAIDSKFENYAFGGDAKIELGPGKLGIGGILSRDVLPQARFAVTTAMLSGAYHYYLDYPEKHQISIGAQIGWVGKSFFSQDLEFGNQYKDYQYNSSLANNENLSDVTINSINVNAGVNYKVKLDYRSRLKLGVNLNSLTTPNESFVSAKNTNQLHRRYIAYAMLDFELNPKIILSPKILYTNQARGEDINFGALATYKLQGCKYVQGGGFYRWKDSGIIMAGFGWQSYLIRASVDLTTSRLKKVGKIEDAGYSAPQAYEIGFIYTGLFRKHENSKITVPCGIF